MATYVGRDTEIQRHDGERERVSESYTRIDG